MPNIIITNYCNLSCPYCFANDIIQEEKHHITWTELQNILTFLNREHGKGIRLGIIGGEPTLHPKFDKILQTIIEFSKEHNFIYPTVFSNGILLSDYSTFFTKDANVLLNLNSSKVIGDIQWTKIIKTLNNLEKDQAFANNNVKLGINLYLNMPDWTYILDLAKNYNQSSIRCSVVVPTNKLKTIDKFQYYNDNKENFLDFLSSAEKFKIKVIMDCNRIPLCYFTDKEKILVLNQTERYEHFCGEQPVLDIFPNMTCSLCFGAGQPISINKFQNLSHLKRYFLLKKVPSLIEKQKIGKCQNCEQINNLSCQGGCFNFINNIEKN